MEVENTAIIGEPRLREAWGTYSKGGQSLWGRITRNLDPRVRCLLLLLCSRLGDLSRVCPGGGHPKGGSPETPQGVPTPAGWGGSGTSWGTGGSGLKLAARKTAGSGREDGERDPNPYSRRRSKTGGLVSVSGQGGSCSRAHGTPSVEDGAGALLGEPWQAPGPGIAHAAQPPSLMV